MAKCKALTGSAVKGLNSAHSLRHSRMLGSTCRNRTSWGRHRRRYTGSDSSFDDICSRGPAADERSNSSRPSADSHAPYTGERTPCIACWYTHLRLVTSPTDHPPLQTYIVHAFILTPSTPAVTNCCCSKGSAPYWSNPLFVMFDIRALWRSVWASERPNVKNYK